MAQSGNTCTTLVAELQSQQIQSPDVERDIRSDRLRPGAGTRSAPSGQVTLFQRLTGSERGSMYGCWNLDGLQHCDWEVEYYVELDSKWRWGLLLPLLGLV